MSWLMKMGRLGSEHNHANGGSSANPASSSSSSSTSTSSSQSHSTNGAAGGGGGGGSPFAHISSSFSSNGSSGSGSRHHRREKPSHSAPHPDTDSALLHSSARSATQPSSNPSPYSSSSLSSKSSLTSSSSAVSASSSSLSESPFFFRTPRLRRRFGNNASTFSSATTTASTSSTTVELSDPSLDSIRQMHTTTQAKVFTKWCNMQLAKLGPDVAVASVLDDLKDGIKLLRLLEALTGIKPPPPEGRGVALRIYHIANVNKALKFIADHAAEPPRQISAEDIVDGNPKLTLGLVWVLIKEWSLSSGAETRSDDLPSSDADFATTAPAAEGDLRLGESAYSFDIARNAEQLSLAPSSVPARSVKEQLLLWVRQILEPYVGIGIMPMITDFTRAWQNGLPFLALVHTFDPLLVPEITEQFARADGKKRTLAIPSSKYLYTTSRKEWAKTLDRAFNLIQTHLSVYRLLDPEDLADVEEPDEKAVMTYVSEIRIALKGIQPFQPGSKVTAQLDGSNRENAKRVIAQCLTECKRLSQWLNRQQEALHRLTSLIYTNESPASLLASLGNSGGWVRRLIALVQDPKGSPESISQGVEEELSKIERSLRQLSPNDSASSPDGGFDSNELTFSQNSLAAARLKVEGYVLKLKSFQSKSRKNDAGITEALETYDALVIQIDSFSAQILPFSSQQLRAYCQFCQDWGKALESLAREFGEDSADSVQVRLDHAHAAQLDLSRVLASVSDTDSATDALKKIRQVETILTSVLGRDISVTKGNTVGELVHSIEHVSFQAENLELPKLRAVENLLAERIQFLEWACLLAKRPRPSTSDFRQSRIGTLSSELNSSQNVLMRSRFTLIPGWVTPQARVFLDKARDVVKTVEEKLIPAFENIVDKCRSFHSSVDTVSVDETVVRQYATSFAKADSLLHDWEGGFRGVDAGNESSSWVAELVAFSRRIQPEVEDFLSNGAAVLDSNWSVIETRVLSDASHIELLPPHNACIQRIGRLLDKLKGVVSSFELERAHKEQEAKSDQQRYFIWKERVVAFEATVMAHADAFLDAAERKIESNGQSIAGVSDFWWNCHDQWQSDLENPDAIGSLETSLIQMVRTFEEGSRDDSWDLKLSWYKIDDESKVLIEQGGILLSELNESLKGSVQDQLRVLDASLSDVRLKRADKSKSVNASSVETLACLSRVEKLVLAATRWLRVRASVHSDVRRILSDITSALTQVEAFTRDPTGKSTVQIEEVLAKSEKTLTAVVAPQIAQWQATYLELVKLAPPEIGQDRPLFEDIEGSLSRELDGAVSMLSDLKTRVEIAVALASVWSELNQAEDLIAHRTSAEQEAVSIPHPLDEACSEQTLVELEKKVANIEGTVTDWQRVMRRAKAEHAVAQLQSLQPEVAIETLVMNRVADILERTEKLVAASRTRWETLNLTRQLFYEVVEPTRAVQVELAAISADVSALSSSLDDAPSGGADVYADLISQAKWLLGRATEVGARLSKCDAIITKRGDSRLRQFFDDVSEGVAKVRASIIAGGSKALRQAMYDWDVQKAAVAEALCTKLEADLSGDVSSLPGEDGLRLLAAKVDDLASSLYNLLASLEPFRDATDVLVQIMGDWRGHLDSLPFAASDYWSDLWEASAQVGGNGRTDYICDMVRGRFSQVVKRADLIDAAIHHTESLLLHGEEILGAAKAVKEDITIVKDAIYTLTQSTSWTLDEFQRKMTDTEQQLLDVASMLDQIKDVVSQLAQPADAVDPNPHQHIVFTVCLDAFEDHYNEWNSESENFTKLKSMRLAFDRYSKRAEELKERLALQVAGFNLVSNEVRHEVRLLQSACADGLEKMEPVVALCLHHCSERSAGVAEAQEMLVEVSQSYSELTTEISQVSVGWVAGVRALATSMLEGISSLHSEVHERFDSMKSDTEALSLLAQFAKKVLAVVLPKVVGQIHKIEAGDGWTQVLASVPSDDTVLPLESFSRSADTVVRLWEDEVISIEDSVEALIAEAHGLQSDCSHIESAGKIFELLTKMSKESTVRLQQLFEKRKSALFEIGSVVDKIVLELAAAEPPLLTILSRIGRHRSLDNMRDHGQGLRIDTSRRPSQFLLTGTEEQRKQLSKMQSSLDDLRKQYSATLEPASKRIEELADSITELASAHVGGSGKVLILEALEQQLSSFRSAMRELARKLADHSASVDGFETMRLLQTELNAIEEDVESVRQQLQSSPEFSLESLSELGKKVETLQATVTLKRYVLSSEMKKRKSITAVSPSTPKEFRKIFPLDPSTESSPPAPDDRRPSQSTAAVIDAAQLSNESALRAKCDSLDIQLAELLSMIDERTAALDRALRGDAATEDLSSWARKRIREANDAISRLPPQALLAPEIVLVDDSSSLYGEITSAVQESVRFYRTASVELAKYKEVLVGSLEVDSDDFNSRSVQMSVLEHLLAKLGDLLDGTKRLRAFDEQCADLLTWVLSAKVAAEDILQRQNSEDSSEDRSEEVDLLEGKIRDFDETMETFLASSSSLSASFPEDEKRFATAVSAKRSVVNEQWIGLQTTLSTLRGSSSERLRRVEFEKAAASVDSLLNGISSRLATHVTSDISSLSVFSELEIELDTIVAPRLGELREMAAVGAHTDFERERYMSRYRLLSEEFRKLGGWLGRERSEKDRSLVVRSVQRELDDILRMQAEFAKISQEAAVSITSPRPNTDPPRLPNLSELEQVLNMLESRYSWYNGEITSLLTNLEPKCQELGMQDKHAGLVKKWSSMKLMKERIAAEGKRRVASKKLAAKSTKTFIPRIASGSTRLGSTPELKPPTSYHQKRAASPSSTRSLSPLPSSFSSTGRLSPLNGSPAAARFTPKSVKVFLPSPNHYVPNPNDPLDVEVASVVNSCPMSIKVVPAGEGKGYWFGDLMPKLCFCRVVREGIVMVRVGGGWQDLRSYLQEHSMLEARLPTVRSFAPSVDEPGADDGSLDAARELNASSLALPSSSSSSSSSSSTSPSGSSSSASTPEKSPAYIVVDTDEVSNPYNLAFHRAMGTWAAKR